MPESFDIEAMSNTAMGPITQRLRRLLQLLEAHQTAEEFAGHVVREIGPEALEAVRLLAQCAANDLKLVVLLVALEAKEQAITNPKKED